ncbi:MAG: hypothetical protein L0H83_01400 [Salinisphaera sp.]|nr:hypothetical protein [Salinisphaera sp.]
MAFGEGFLRGYGFVHGLQANAAQRKFQSQQAALAREQWQKSYALQEKKLDSSIADTKQRLALAQDKAQATEQYRAASLGLQRDKLATSQSQYRAQQAELQRQLDEQQRQRLFASGINELTITGELSRPTRLALKAEGFPVAALIDPQKRQDFAQSLDVLTNGVQGVPYRRDVLLDAANTVLAPRLNKVVGTVNQYGETIVDSKIVDVVPARGRDGDAATDHVFLETLLTTNTGRQYRKPITLDRSTDPNDPVKAIPVGDFVKYLKGSDLLLKGLDQSKLLAGLQGGYIRAGGDLGEEQSDNIQEVRWLARHVTGDTQAAAQMVFGAEGKSQGQLTEDIYRAINERRDSFTATKELQQMSDEQVMATAKQRAETLYSMLNDKAKTSPPVLIENPGPDLIEKLKTDGSFQATSGKFKGRTILITEDGSVLAR